MRRALVLGPARRLLRLQCADSIGKRLQSSAQRLDVPMLSIDDITQLVVGTLEEGNSGLESLDGCGAHSAPVAWVIICCSR